jgi:hypothetical protein
MSPQNKALRSDAYQFNNFGGTSDWAVDLQALLNPGDLADSTGSGTNAEICNMPWTTNNNDISVAATTIASTWAASGAGTYLDTFLKNYQSSNGGSLNGWLLNFFETVSYCGQQKGGSSFDCTDITSNCGAPVQCSLYCPTEAFFIHTPIYNPFNTYKSFYQSIATQGIVGVSSTINNISDTFAPPNTSLAEFFTILTGILSTVAGLGAFIGAVNIDAPSITAVANGIAAFSGIFTDIGLGIAGSGGSTTEALEEIYGSTVDTIFNALNGTIEKIFDNNHGSIGGNITYIESFFQDGTQIAA